MSHRRILLIEDNENNRYLVSFLLQARGWEVALSAVNGQTVAAEAFVLVAPSGVRRLPVAHRVGLLSVDQVVALVLRKEAILADRSSPQYAAQAGDDELDGADVSAGHRLSKDIDMPELAAGLPPMPIDPLAGAPTAP